MESVLDVEVSCFANYKDPNHPRPVNLLTWLTSTKHRAKVDAIRALSDKKERDKIKATLPAITPSGLFTRREDSALVPGRHSRLICLDIDRTHNTKITNYADLKAEISQIKSVAYCGLSVSGTGFFVLILIAYPNQHRAQFRALQLIFKKRWGIDVDDTPDVSRLRGYSCDPDGYFNHSPQPFTGVDNPPKPQTRPAVYERFSRQGEDQHLLTWLVRRTESAGEGNRHITLRNSARLAGGFAAAGRLDEQTAVFALETLVSEWPTFRKSQKTIRDGIRDGLRYPIWPVGPLDQPQTATTPLKPRPRWIRDGQIIYGEVLVVEPCDKHPAEWG